MFELQVALGVLVGGAWISGTTLGAQRLGSHLGGFLSGLPSTMVVSLIFIGWTQGGQVARDATAVMPIALAINAVLLMVFAALADRGFAGALGASLAAWATLQAVVVVLNLRDFVLGIAICGVVLWAGRALMAGRMGLRSVPGPALRWSWNDALLRGVVGGGMVGAATVLTRLAGPTLGGVIAVFPAVILSTLTIVHRAVGTSFSRALVPSFMTSMLLHCVAYALIFRWSVVDLGPWWASALSYAGVLALSAGTYRFFLAELRGSRTA